MPGTGSLVPPLRTQADRLVALGLHQVAGVSEDAVRAAAAQPSDSSLLVIHPQRLHPSRLAPLLQRAGKPGFVVVDMVAVDEFTPVTEAATPASALYLLHGLDRGDALAGWSPTEALPAITGAGRTPLTLTEGLHWVLQNPDVLEPGSCFMTIGSRRRDGDGRLDARVPAVWISGGTGRDGPSRRHAPKVGWCWAGNRHTWLGFASADGREGLPS